MVFLKRFRIGISELILLALVVVAIVLRIALISLNWPTTNSDESVIDLMALHIAFRGEHPIFYYGQSYLGSLEAHLASPFVLLLGPSVFTVRLLLITLFALFLILLYNLTSKLYSRKLALFSVLLLSFGSLDMLIQELKAFGRYPDILVLSTSLLLLTAHLALTTPTATLTIRRRLLFLLEGILCGLAVWTDQITLPFVGLSLLLLLVFCRREVRGWNLVGLLAGFLLCISPMAYYNISMPITHNTFNDIINVNKVMANEMAAHNISPWRRLVGSLLFALPAITGFNPVCTTESLPLFGPTTAATFTCSITQGLWSLGYLVLWGSATVMAVTSLWRHWPRQEPLAKSPAYRTLVLEALRLALLLSAGAILLLYTVSASSAVNPGPTARYLLSMCVALPAILWPLWRGIQTLAFPEKGGERLLFFARVGALLLILVMLVVGTIRTFADTPNAQAAYERQQTLVSYLLSHQQTRIYSEYWTCNRLIFASDENILCSNLDYNLEPGQNRYPEYATIVGQVPSPTYVFPLTSLQAHNFEATRYASDPTHYRRETVAGYVIYSRR
ncbi:hypothetical protein KSC_074690 [Ktedonobacter sp. SOSP1-52]|nr:hypothetical protein KSC_074690 [Ktedonobacter sp. SOSP1-52]